MRAAGIAVNFPICQSAHDRRLAWLQGDPKTRYSSRGVIAIDKTLGDHAGKLIADVGWCLAHTALCLELITDAMARGIPGDVTFASYFTSAKVLNHLESSKRAYVRDVKLNRKVVYDGREPSLQAVVRQIPWQAKKPVRMGSRRYWYSRKQMRIPEVKHPVRIVVVWQERDDAEVSKARVSHRLTWEVIRMVLGYRHRWTGTEML